MKILVSIDSFKGSLSSLEAGLATKEGILEVYPNANVKVLAIADGGEGTVDAILNSTDFRKIAIKTVNANHDEVEAYYALKDDKAVIEVASSVGITLVKEKKPFAFSSYGVGLMIKDAINRNIKELIIGLGGSVTNDAGLGMMQALGYKFYDKNGKILPSKTTSLAKVAKIDYQGAIDLGKIKVTIASDVKNPLCGKNGATFIFGQQKGVKLNELDILDNSLNHFATIMNSFFGKDKKEIPGSGAAGGIGFALLNIFDSVIRPGIDVILEVNKFKDEVLNTDIVITGEGRLDRQTAFGKAPFGIASMAKKYKKPVIAFAGIVKEDAKCLNTQGIDAYFPIIQELVSLTEALDKKNAASNLKNTVEQVFRIIKTFKGD